MYNRLCLPGTCADMAQAFQMLSFLSSLQRVLASGKLMMAWSQHSARGVSVDPGVSQQGAATADGQLMAAVGWAAKVDGWRDIATDWRMDARRWVLDASDLTGTRLT